MKLLKTIFEYIGSSIILGFLIWLGYNYDHGQLPEWLTMFISICLIIVAIICVILIILFFAVLPNMCKRDEEHKAKIVKEEIEKYGYSPSAKYDDINNLFL